MPPTPIIETRLIYTQGLYKLSDAMRSCRQITIVSDLLRFPSFTVYANEKSNPSYYFLGYYTLWTGDYVQKRLPLEFTEQTLLLYDNSVLQLSNLLLAAATNINSVVQGLGAAMTPPAVVILYPLPDVTAEGCPYTDLKFKMPLGTRIQVTAIGIPVEEYEGSQGVAPSLHQPSDTVPRYPLDRDPSQDPPRSDPYPDEVPGDTAPATSEDPDSGLETPPPPLPICYKVLTGNATSSNTPGQDIVYNGAQSARWVRGNVVSSERLLITGGYYNGCYGVFLVVDGVIDPSFGANMVITADLDNVNCPS